MLARSTGANDAGELPDVERALANREKDDEDWRSLVSGLQDQLDRAVTSAFSGPFLLAAALALCALVPLAVRAERRDMRRAFHSSWLSASSPP